MPLKEEEAADTKDLWPEEFFLFVCFWFLLFSCSCWGVLSTIFR